MFREPEDVLEHFGWPWHGLIADGNLELPSGRVIECKHVGWDTQLWDIGMPDPGITSADPDEQWISVAIVRGEAIYNTWEIYGGAASAGNSIYRAPTRINGQNYRGISILTGVEFSTGVLTISSGSLSVSITPAEMGLPVGVRGLYASVIDSALSRGRWIVRYDGDLSSRLAFLLVSLDMVSGELQMSVSVLASYADVGVYTGVIDETLNIPPTQRVRWRGGEMVTKNPGDSGYFLPIGSHAARAIGHCVVNAWFADDGSVEMQRGWIEAETFYECLNPTEDAQTIVMGASGSVWLSNESGGVATEPIAFKFIYTTRNVGISSSVRDVRLELNGDVVEEYSFSAEKLYPIILEEDWHAWSGVDGWITGNDFYNSLNVGPGWWNGSDLHKIYGSIFGSRPSNKLIQNAISVYRRDGSRKIALGHALTPRGVDLGLVTHDTIISPVPENFYLGTYNPITGAVVRNHTDGRRYSWV